MLIFVFCAWRSYTLIDMWAWMSKFGGMGAMIRGRRVLWQWHDAILHETFNFVGDDGKVFWFQIVFGAETEVPTIWCTGFLVESGKGFVARKQMGSDDLMVTELEYAQGSSICCMYHDLSGVEGTEDTLASGWGVVVCGMHRPLVCVSRLGGVFAPAFTVPNADTVRHPIVARCMGGQVVLAHVEGGALHVTVCGTPDVVTNSVTWQDHVTRFVGWAEALDAGSLAIVLERSHGGLFAVKLTSPAATTVDVVSVAAHEVWSDDCGWCLRVPKLRSAYPAIADGRSDVGVVRAMVVCDEPCALGRPPVVHRSRTKCLP